MHPKVLDRQSWNTARKLVGAGLLESWTLAGGTALALQFGHRYSNDLDFFRHESFDVARLVNSLTAIGRVEIHSRSLDTLHVSLNGLRVSFLLAQAPLLFAATEYRGLALADPRDIAVMKLVAIGGRGSRKDFVDLYFLLRGGMSLEGMFTLLRRQCTAIDYNEYHLLKSLVYFDDAETEPMPAMIREVSWDAVKTEILEAVSGSSGPGPA